MRSSEPYKAKVDSFACCAKVREREKRHLPSDGRTEQQKAEERALQVGSKHGMGDCLMLPIGTMASKTDKRESRQTERGADKWRSSIEPHSGHIIGAGRDSMVESIVNSFRVTLTVIMNKRTNGLLCFLCIPWDFLFLVFLLRGLPLGMKWSGDSRE